MNNKNLCPTESQEQTALLQWVRLKTPQFPELALLFHCPLGGHRHPVVGAKLKREGVTKGFPDLFLPVPRGPYHGLMIELKRVKGGTVSKAQKWWISQLNEQGYRAEVCHGANEAIRVIEGYLTPLPTKMGADCFKFKDGIAHYCLDVFGRFPNQCTFREQVNGRCKWAIPDGCNCTNPDAFKACGGAL